MEYAPLIIVKDLFQLSGIGLTVVPDFPVPAAWKNRVEDVMIEAVGRAPFETSGQFNLTHFNFGGREVEPEKRWRILLTLPNLTREALPIGSRILVSSELQRLLVRHDG